MRITQRRRNFFEWLNGPVGQALRNPLPGSTNYISQYDEFGVLKRVKLHGDGRAAATSNSTKGEGENEGKSEGGAVAGAEPTKDEMALKQAAEEAAAKGEAPPPTKADLRPFPLNPAFHSTPVLSEELREHVYRLWAERGESVEVISARYGIAMERVAAVLRMKQMEKDWDAAVSSCFHLLDFLPEDRYRPKCPFDDDLHNISISLEDETAWLDTAILSLEDTARRPAVPFSSRNPPPLLLIAPPR